MGLHQPDGGFVLSERCIVNHVFAAQERGGEVHAREQVLEWRMPAGTACGSRPAEARTKPGRW